MVLHPGHPVLQRAHPAGKPGCGQTCTAGSAQPRRARSEQGMQGGRNSAGHQQRSDGHYAAALALPLVMRMARQHTTPLVRPCRHAPHRSAVATVDSASCTLQKDMPRVPEILKAIPQSEIDRMQANIARVWRRCAGLEWAGCVRLQLFLRQGCAEAKWGSGSPMRRQ